MRTYIPFAAGIAIFLLIHLLGRSNTRIGMALRESDHQAWQYAIEDKEIELAELRAHEPRK